MHDGDQQAYRLQKLHEHRVTECSVNKASRWWLSAALGRILGQTAAAEILNKSRAHWQQHTVAALTDYWSLRVRGLIEPSQQAKFHHAVACYMNSLTRRGHVLPDLNIYGDIDGDMELQVEAAQNVPAYWWDGLVSDDEIDLVSGQCIGTASMSVQWPQPLLVHTSARSISPVHCRSVSARPMPLRGGGV